LLGIGAVAVAVVLTVRGDQVPWAVWMRSGVVLAMTLTLFYFAWRAQRGYYWAYSRLRLFSKIFPVVTLVIAAIPGLYPLWMVTEQIVFSLVLIGVSDYLSSPSRTRTPAAAQALAVSGALRGGHGTTADVRFW
jgi:hypothetical protein